MARHDLEKFLNERGFATGSQRAYFNAGFLNRIYVRAYWLFALLGDNIDLLSLPQFFLDEVIFSGTSCAIPIHLGSSPLSLPFSSLDTLVPPRRSGLSTSSKLTTDTGGGTDHDDPNIRPRAAFRFEQIWDEPSPKFGTKGWTRDLVVERMGGAVMKWLGLVQRIHDRPPEVGEGVKLDLKHGRAGWELPRRGK
jgi:hypothetical protein